jgi:two-component system, chemotaxis family, CheB/CheR fusion protein
MTDGEDRDFETLLRFLRDSRGFDFTGYKRTSLRRRVNKRMELVGIDSYAAYLDHLQVHPDEFTSLFNFILINVTSFFRDEQIWRYVADEIIPAIIRGKAPDESIRVWDAGCASGEEAYSLALLFAEALGKEEFRERVKIYATDVDGEALEEARHAAYTPKQMEPVPDELVRNYFLTSNGNFVLDQDVRRAVVFGRHDLVSDAPISRIDLLVCRNTLMYFNSDLQGKILQNFRFALNPSGFMLLGKAEMLFTRVRSFTPIDLKKRVFRPTDDRRADLAPRGGPREPELEPDVDTQRAAFESSPTPQLLIDSEGRVVKINASMRSLFMLSRDDVGRRLQDLEVSYRPVELRSRIDEAHARGSEVTVNGVDWKRPSGALIKLDIEVVPLFDAGGNALGTIVSFDDVTQYYNLEEELHTSHQELETAMEELQSTNEELETTNEELQSTNEELETTNEELQSTNEELETMNEELQSTNEELEAVNQEARERTVDLDDTNAFLAAVLEGIRAGMIVVDRDLQVRAWNRRAQDLWGLRADEVDGHPLTTLDIGLPVGSLLTPMRTALNDSTEVVEVDATTRRGRAMRCRVTISPLRASAGRIDGVILVMEEAEA